MKGQSVHLGLTAADSIKSLTHCSAVVLPENRLVQVRKQLFLNVKQHLQIRSKQHLNTTVIVVVVIGWCGVIPLPGDHCLFPHRWFSPLHCYCLSSQFARLQMWTDAVRGKSNTGSICVKVLGRCVSSTPELQRNWRSPGPDSARPDGSWNLQRGRTAQEDGGHRISYRETGLSEMTQMWSQPISNSLKIINKADIAIYQQLIKVRKFQSLGEEDFLNSLSRD